MPPNVQARKTHDALFPGQVSTLAVTDPELIETVDDIEPVVCAAPGLQTAGPVVRQ